jgi:two-component system sporulation sensor kinase B
MLFPIASGDGFVWDLRWIPFLMAYLYGGYRGGLVALVFILGYRWYLGGGLPFYIVVFDAVILSALALSLRTYFQSVNRYKKTWFALGIAVFAYVWVMGTIFWYFDYQGRFSFIASHSVWFYGVMALSYQIGLVLSMYLVENIEESVKIREEIQRSEKLSIISQLAASIAHEVRNPLTVVRGFIQLASGSMDEKNRGYMQTAIAELDRAEFIISDYLNFAKPELENIEVMDVAKQLRDVVEVMNSFALMRGVELSSTLTDGLLIRADRIKFKQVVMNLIKNSVEAIDGAGTIQVELMMEVDEIVVKVRDSGVGMNKEELERLGNPFYSTKEKGTGLGLMVTFRMVEAMGGRLQFTSEKGKGTEATIRLQHV